MDFLTRTLVRKIHDGWREIRPFRSSIRLSLAGDRQLFPRRGARWHAVQHRPFNSRFGRGAITFISPQGRRARAPISLESSMRYSRSLVSTLLALFLLASASGWAQEGGDAKKLEDLEKLLKKFELEDNGEKDEEFRPLDKVVKDMTKREGFLDLYVNEKKHKLYALLPGSLQKEPFLLATSISRGPGAGHQWDHKLLQIERLDKKVLFVEPNTFETGSGTLKEVVERTYPSSVYAAADILSVSNGGVLVDLGQLLTNLSGGGYGDVVELKKAKSFPDNNEIELFLRPIGGGNDYASWWTPQPQGVHFSFSRLPDSDYKPREADDRIGYFIEAQEDFSKDETEPTKFRRIIQRWHLEKADSDLDLSPPTEPIVFYIEKSVPVKYRRAVADGIREWNKAFEKVGFVDAVVVRQQTENNEFANLDPEDARYNFFRWIASGSAFAIGPRRADPRTGQIYDADILFDESMVRVWTGEFDQMVDKSFREALSPRERRQLMMRPWEHPNWPAMLDEYIDLSVQAGPARRPAFQDFLAERVGANMMTAGDHSQCTLGSDLCRQNALAQLMLGSLALSELEGEGSDDEGGEGTVETAEDGEKKDESAKEGEKKEDSDKKEESAEEKEAKKKKEEKRKELEKKREALRERMVYEMIRSTVAHEVGHVLGLRHNFKASSWKSLEEIQNAKAGEPIVASVMDYPAANLPDSLDFEAPFSPYVIGPYDLWAIEYGYAIAGDGDRDSNEKKMLAKIADRVAEPGLAYSSDEDRWSPDPLVNVWDLGNDSLAFSTRQLALADKAIANILKAGVKDDESFAMARRAFQMAFYEYYGAAGLAARYIGGHEINRAHKGDPNAKPPVVVVSAAKQREAMKFLEERILSRDALKVVSDPELQRHLTVGRWWHRGMNSWGSDPVFAIQDEILQLHKGVLYDLLSSDAIQYLYDSSFRVDAGDDLFALPELFDRLTVAIFGEVFEPATGDYSLRAPMITDIRRNLQREYVGRLIAISLRDETDSQPAVARALAQIELERVKDGIDKLLGGESKGDAYTRAHLTETRRRINEALEADFTINGGGGGGGFPFAFLFGQPAGPQAAEETHPSRRVFDPARFGGSRR
jgi:hypothetical protein